MRGIAFDLLIYVSPSVITIIILTIIDLIAATRSYKTFICGCKVILSSKFEIADSEREKAVDLFRLLSKSTIIAALTGTFVALQILDNPEGFSHALISSGRCLMVGLLVSLTVFEPAAFLIKKR